MVIAVVYLPPAGQRWQEQRQQELAEVSKFVRRFGVKHNNIIIGGDLNCRIAVNGDSVTNAEGSELLRFSLDHQLTIVNQLPRICSGKHSWERKRGAEIQRSTIDYVLCSSHAIRFIKKMRIMNAPSMRLGSVTTDR